MNLPTKESSLQHLLEVMRMEGPTSDYSKKVFLEVLKLLPPAPNIPGAEVFRELGKKTVGYYIDFALIRDGEVYLTYREDEHYLGWHFPGFCRTPETEVIDDCQRAITKELGDDVKILSMQSLHGEDRVHDPRNHHFSDLMLLEFKGEPFGKEGKGQWFSAMPEDMLVTQVCFWPKIDHLLHD